MTPGRNKHRDLIHLYRFRYHGIKPQVTCSIISKGVTLKFFLIFLVAVLASLSSFLVHVITAEWLSSWVGSQMQGLQIQPSWNVRYIAAVTSLEYGFAAIGLYYLARNKLLVLGVIKASILFSVLLASIHGAFIRQPFMDYVVGNPLNVVLVQNAFKWLVWLLMSFVVVFGFEFVVKISSIDLKNQE